MAAKSAEWYRKVNQDASTNATLTAASDDTTLIDISALTNASSNSTIYVQRIEAWMTTSTTATWAFKSSTSGKQVFNITASPGASTNWGIDYGAAGIPLTESEDLVLDVSATGAAGSVVVEAYIKQTSNITASTVASY